MDNPTFEERASQHRATLWFHRHIFNQFNEFGREPVNFCTEKYAILLASYRSIVRVTKVRSRLYECLQHGRQIEGRAADDFEHIRSSGLLLQRFTQLVQQARVLDGDDGLSGETLHQLDLLLGERADLCPVDREHADDLIMLEHRDRGQCPYPCDIDRAHSQWMVGQIALIEFQVGNLDRLPLSDNASHWNAYVVEADHRSALPLLLVGFRQRAVERSVAIDISVSQPKRPIARLGQPRRIRQHGLEHRLEIAWRSADDLQHLRSRRLLLQRLAQILRALPQLTKQARVLDGDNGLVGEVRQQLDLFVGERPNL